MSHPKQATRQLESTLQKWNWVPCLPSSNVWTECSSRNKEELHQIKSWTFPSSYRGTMNLATFCHNRVWVPFSLSALEIPRICSVRLRWLHKREEADEMREQDWQSQKCKYRDFSGGPVVKNLPSNAGDAGLIPGWGTKIPYATGQLRPRTLEPASHN